MTTDPTHGTDAGAAEGAASPDAPKNKFSSAKGGSRDAEKQKKQSPYSLRLLDELFKSGSEDDMKNDKFPFLPVFVCFAIIAPIMLVGLPLGALLIVHNSECCTNESVASFFTFWGSVLGGMLALFGILIAAVFVITALRIDKSAKVEAQAAAVKAVGQFMLKYKREFLKQTDRWLRKVEKVKDDAVASIETAKQAAESKSRTAIAKIEEAQGNVDRKAQQTTNAMDQAVRDVENERTAAVERIGAEVAEFERSVGQTVEDARARINAAVADVEQAAAEARARIEGQQGGDPSSGGSL